MSVTFECGESCLTLHGVLDGDYIYCKQHKMWIEVENLKKKTEAWDDGKGNVEYIIQVNFELGLFPIYHFVRPTEDEKEEETPEACTKHKICVNAPPTDGCWFKNPGKCYMARPHFKTNGCVHSWCMDQRGEAAEKETKTT